MFRNDLCEFAGYGKPKPKLLPDEKVWFSNWEYTTRKVFPNHSNRQVMTIVIDACKMKFASWSYIRNKPLYITLFEDDEFMAQLESVVFEPQSETRSGGDRKAHTVFKELEPFRLLIQKKGPETERNFLERALLAINDHRELGLRYDDFVQMGHDVATIARLSMPETSTISVS